MKSGLWDAQIMSNAHDPGGAFDRSDHPVFLYSKV
jgi:hypothetical protein